MLNNDLFLKAVEFVVTAHGKKSTKDPVRRWDGKTPYAMHPVWCSMTLMSETSLAEEIRLNGSVALCLHDVIEDTDSDLPPWVPDKSVKLVREMTFNTSAEEFEKLWERSDTCKLLKLYDKVSNLLDGSWMPDEKWNKYCDLTHQLIKFVEHKYGELNIVKIARAIAERR